MFFMGLFLGLAVASTIALGTVLGMIWNGKTVLAAGNNNVVAAAPSPAAPSAPTAPSAPVKPVSDSDHIIGSKNAKVTLIEYSDFECPFCKRHFDTVEQALKDFPKDVRLVYRHYPLSFHANAQKEAEASECAAKLGGNDAFWKMHDKIFTLTTSNGTGFALDKLGTTAKEIGLDQTKFQKCLDSGEMAARVAADTATGNDSGVQGTPATFVNGNLISGAVPYEGAQGFKAAIQAAGGKG